ncbi:hypothetical protein CL616_03935 [archaeon]|nr:hypothetical protein [archaeon]
MEEPIFKYKKSKYNLDIVYPNKYYGGLYNLGILIIYNLVNQRKDWNCNRVFLDKNEISSDLVGFSLQYELDLKNVLEMKKKCNGLCFAGGPVVNMNPEKFRKYFDFLILGEVEGVLDKVLDEYEKGDGFLERISKLKGVYVDKISYNFNKELIEYPYVQPFPEKISKDFVFGKCFMLEIERGCPFQCKFCVLPGFFPKVRYRKNWKEIIDRGLELNKRDRVVIYSASFTHPERKEILKYLLTKNVRVSVPSIKVGVVDKETISLIKKLGQKSITIAPEANEKLRFSMGKMVSDNQYRDFVEECNEVGIEKLKLYMIIGVPGMEERDIIEMREFVDSLKFKGRIYVSVNYFVPKPKSDFEDFEFDNKELKKQAKIVEREFKKYKVKLTGLNSSYLEWKISRTGSL